MAWASHALKFHSIKWRLNCRGSTNCSTGPRGQRKRKQSAPRKIRSDALALRVGDAASENPGPTKNNRLKPNLFFSTALPDRGIDLRPSGTYPIWPVNSIIYLLVVEIKEPSNLIASLSTSGGWGKTIGGNLENGLTLPSTQFLSPKVLNPGRFVCGRHFAECREV